MTTAKPHPKPSLAVLTLVMAGPDRKRTPSLYHYRVTYRNPDPGELGCVMTWEVTGGRQPYALALERRAGNEFLWHCSCADAVYRGEDDPNHVCKHVAGLMDCTPTVPRVRRAKPVPAAA